MRKQRVVTSETQAEWNRRTAAGMEKARAKGKRLGRPRCSPIDLLNGVDFLERGHSLKDAAALAGVSSSSLQRHLDECLEAEEQDQPQSKGAGHGRGQEG